MRHAVTEKTLPNFEGRIAAAAAATASATAAVHAVIASGAQAMAESWSFGTAEAEESAAQQARIAPLADEYKENLAGFSSSYPDARPDPNVAPMPLPGGAGALRLDDVESFLKTEMHAARRAAADASVRLFSGRDRQIARHHAQSALSLIKALDVECERLAAARTEALEQRDAEAAALRAEADQALQEAQSNLAEAMLRLPPAMSPWNSPVWHSWAPGITHSHVLLGALHPQAGQAAPGKNHSFAWAVRTPVFASVRGAMEIKHRRQDRESALGLARSLLLRALACTPPGKLRLSVFDPTGLGQSVASLLELGEYDRDLIGGKVWSSAEDLQRVLAEHTAHIELVIQKYLRAEYATLDEFNTAAGEIAEPHRLLVIVDAPTGFDERSQAELRRIVESGPRCGVATLLLTDEDVERPHGVSLATLPQSMQRVSLHEPFTTIDGTTIPLDLLPATDADAPDQVVESIVDQVGRSAQESTADAVSFEKSFRLFSQAAAERRKRGLPRLTAPLDLDDPATWWTQSTLESVAAPIGQRGARDVATLTFDSANHSGALLVGRPGSGKSTLLHTFIAGITTLYGPEELELHLIDFKEGVEFKVYAADALPHARTVAIESDREFGVSVLQAINEELAWRGSLLRGSQDAHSSLETLRRATGERLPRIVLVFDEFQVLFARNDKLGAVAAEMLETLIRQGRGFGIHVILGSQSLAGLDALGSHVPQLLPVRILLPAADSDVFKVLGEGNAEGAALTTAGEGILNMAGGAVEANERFRGALLDEESRRSRVTAMRKKADEVGFHRRPVVFEGNAPIPAADTPPAQFVDELRGADPRTLRLRFGTPMAVAGSADINIRRESGANVLLVARDTPTEPGSLDAFSLPRAVTANVALSAVAGRVAVEVVDFMPADEGLEDFVAPLVETGAVKLSRRRQVPDLLGRIGAEVERRVDQDEVAGPATLLVLYGMHRARDFDQDSIDYDAEADLPEMLRMIMRDGPEAGIHTFLWFDTVTSIGRRLPSNAVREASWRLAGKMSADDSSSFVGVDSASSLRDQQLLAVNEDRGVLQRCTTISQPDSQWIRDLLDEVGHRPMEPVQ